MYQRAAKSTLIKRRPNKNSTPSLAVNKLRTSLEEKTKPLILREVNMATAWLKPINCSLGVNLISMLWFNIISLRFCVWQCMITSITKENKTWTKYEIEPKHTWRSQITQYSPSDFVINCSPCKTFLVFWDGSHSTTLQIWSQSGSNIQQLSHKMITSWQEYHRTQFV